MKKLFALSILLVLLVVGPGFMRSGRGPDPSGRGPVRADVLHSTIHQGGTSGLKNAKVDSFRIMGPVGPYFGNFEQYGAPNWNGWSGLDLTADSGNPVGDYADIQIAPGEIDACSENGTPQLVFVDAAYTFSSWDYGPGGAVVNPEGGLAGPGYYIYNVAQSPVMDWPEPMAGGALLEFDVYRHLPYGPGSPGLFYVWLIRSVASGQDITQAEWRSRDITYYGDPATIRHHEYVTDLLVPDRVQVQVALGVKEEGYIWGWEGTDATPAPYFDNVAFTVFQTEGPAMSAVDVHLAQDNFPGTVGIDFDNPGAHIVPFDMALNISPPEHNRNDPGDSVVINVVPVRPATFLPTVPRMRYLVEQNLLFNPAPRPATGLVDGVPAGPGRYSFDLDDPIQGTTLFPGDVVHYRFEATDDLNMTTTLPADLTDWNDFTASTTWDAAFTMRALPTLDPSMTPTLPGAAPPILFWFDAAGQGGLDEWMTAFRNCGYRLGFDYDIYTTQAPSAGAGNGLGGRANPDLLAGYTEIVYSSGDLGVFTLASVDLGVGAGDDVGLLTAWLDTGGRDLLLTGDKLASDLASSGPSGYDFLSDRMALELVSSDLLPEIDYQLNPTVRVEPGDLIPYLEDHQWFVHGGCPGINRFDAVRSIDRVDVETFAQFMTPGCVWGQYPLSAGTHAYEETFYDYNRIITLPYDFQFIHTGGCEAKVGEPSAARTKVLEDIIHYFGPPPSVSNATAIPDPANCTAEFRGLGPTPPSVSVMVAPGSAGDRLDAARVQGGSIADATITLTVLDGDIAPIKGYPAEDMWLQSTLGGLVTCPSGAIADRETDKLGETTFSGPVYGGGHTNPATERTQVIISGEAIAGELLDLQFNSPDLNGNLMVDILDVADFTTLFYSFTNDFAVDYNWDESVDLLDAVALDGHFSKGCTQFVNLPGDASTLGIYFDTAGTQNSTTASGFTVIPVYLILKNATGDTGVLGFENRIEITGPAAIANWEYLPTASQSVNVSDASEGEFNVGFGQPMPIVPNLALAQATLIYTGTLEEPVDIYIKPPTRASRGAGTGPAYIRADAREIVQTNPASGSFDLPVAQINPADVCGDDVWSQEDPCEFCGSDAYAVIGHADMNHDCDVDFIDVAMMEWAVQTQDPSGNLTGDVDGLVNLDDVVLFNSSLHDHPTPIPGCTSCGVEPVGCAGTLRVSFSADPTEDVPFLQAPETAPPLGYIVAEGCAGLGALTFDLVSSASVDVSFSGGCPYSTAYPPCDAAPRIVGTFVYVMPDPGAEAWIRIVPCAGSYSDIGLSWVSLDPPQELRFADIRHGAINGPIPVEGGCDLDCNNNGIPDLEESTRELTFCIYGESTNVQWEWGIQGPGGAGFSYVIQDEGPLPLGADGTAFAHAFIDAINTKACGSIVAEPLGNPMTMCFKVTVPGDQGFNFGVARLGEPMSWMGTGTVALTADFNPTVNLVSSTGVPIIRKFFVHCYPNPFNPMTQIAYELPRDAHLTIRIFNARGELVKVLVDEEVRGGADAVTWNGTDSGGARVAAGVYFYQATALGKTKVGKIALVK